MASLSDMRPSVASELEAIFAPLPRLAPAMPADAPASRRAAPRRIRLWPWLALIVFAASAGLIGGLLFLRPVLPRPDVVRTAPSVPMPVAPVETVQTTAAPPPVPAPAPAAHEPVPAARAPAPAPTRAERPVPPSVPRGRCPRFATEAWCLHGTIMAADDQLRDTYAAATRAGVDRAVLVDVRNDWNRLRGRANRDPQALIRGYALLTGQLRAEMRRAAR